MPPTAGPLAKGRAKTKRAAPQLARRYTGPLFEKYNAVLRGLPNRVEDFVSCYMEKCRGNRCECSPLQPLGLTLVICSDRSVGYRVCTVPSPNPNHPLP